MSVTITPPPPPTPAKKRGFGCLGCGCLILALLALLLAGLVGGICYVAYTSASGLTSATPATASSYDGGDPMYQSARQKIADFDHDLKNHHAATIRLSADELNTLIARNPDLAKRGIHLYVTLNNNEAQMQWACPTSVLPVPLFAGRYFNGSTDFRVSYDPNDKAIDFDFKNLEVGNDLVLIGESEENSQASSAKENFMRGFAKSFAPAFTKSFNDGIRKNPDGAALLDQAKTVEVKDGELVIETR